MNNPSSKSKPPKLDSLSDVEKYLKKLRTDIHSGDISSQEIDFIPIFHSIQQIVNKENLRTLISEFQNSSDLFRRKIEEIRAYISSIGGSEDFEKVVKFQTQDTINELFQALYKPPFTVDDINIDSLIGSFTSLTNRKNLFGQFKFSEYSDIDTEEIKHQFNGYIDDVHFKKDLEKFADTLIPQLPLSLTELLKSAPDVESRYTYFVYCLYLIQLKLVQFDKKNNTLQKYMEDAEK